jgi:hypothetical protein
MYQKPRRGRKGKKKGPKSMTQNQIINTLQKEGKERILICAATARLPIPRPLHSQFRTRQMVLVPLISNGIGSGGATQSSYIEQVTPATLVFGSAAFSLQDVDQVASFTAVFDQYRIDRVVMQVKTQNNVLNFNTASLANSSPPQTYWVVDRDDSSVLTTLAQARQYDNVQEATAMDNVEIDLQPSVTPAVYAAGAFSGYAIVRTGMWLDCNNVSIPHYGVKWAITELSAAATDTYYWNVFFYYYLSFRNVR